MNTNYMIVCMIINESTHHFYILNDKAPMDWCEQLIMVFPEWHYHGGYKLDITSLEYKNIISDINKHSQYISGLFNHPRFEEVYDELCKKSMHDNNLIRACNKPSWIYCIWNKNL